MDDRCNRDLLAYLADFISDSKKRVIEKVLINRTRFITVVLEDIFQPQNASAVVRSCDCFGIQDLHIVENRNEYTLNPDVTLGASKWVDLYRYNTSDKENTTTCLNTLEDKGYVIYATSPKGEDLTVGEIDFDHKIALMFGTELTGLSEYALAKAHKVVKIPMYGFTESYNLSVSVALSLHSLINKLHRSSCRLEAK